MFDLISLAHMQNTTDQYGQCHRFYLFSLYFASSSWITLDKSTILERQNIQVGTEPNPKPSPLTTSKKAN